MSKKKIAIIFLLAVCLLLTACGGKKTADLPKFPDGSEKLSKADLGSIKDWFNEEPIRRRFLLSTYSVPSDVDLYSLFLLGTGDDYVTGIDDISMFLGQNGWWGKFELSRITDEGMDSVLSSYAGISFSDCAKRHLDKLYYVEAASCRYSVHGDIETAEFSPLGGYRMNDRVCVFYESSLFVNQRFSGVFRVTLTESGSGYRIAANEFCSDGEYLVDLYKPSENGSAFDSSETVEKVEMTAVPSLQGTDVEDAQKNIRAQDGFLNVTVNGLRSVESPEYGRIIAGKLNDELVLYYADNSGTVYLLPLPEGDYEKDDISLFSGDIYLIYMVEQSSDSEEALSVSEHHGTILLPTCELFIRTITRELSQAG